MTESNLYWLVGHIDALNNTCLQVLKGVKVEFVDVQIDGPFGVDLIDGSARIKGLDRADDH